MKTNKYLLFPIILLFLTSCYIYKPYQEKTEEELAKMDNSMPVAKSIRNEKSSDEAAQRTREQQGAQLNAETMENELKKQGEKNQEQPNQEQPKANEKSNSSSSASEKTIDNNSKRSVNKGTVNTEENKPKETGIKGKLQPNKYYKITALDHQYKIQVDKWEGDTLVSHKIRKPKKVYRHHINDIQEDAILERRFSKPFSDLLTVGAYASGAAIVLLLIL